jgi:hypothetical protein
MVSVACGLIFVSCGECQSSVSLARAKMSTVSNRGVVGGWIAAFAVVAIVAGSAALKGNGALPSIGVEQGVFQPFRA